MASRKKSAYEAAIEKQREQQKTVQGTAAQPSPAYLRALESYLGRDTTAAARNMGMSNYDTAYLHALQLGQTRGTPYMQRQNGTGEQTSMEGLAAYKAALGRLNATKKQGVIAGGVRPFERQQTSLATTAQGIRSRGMGDTEEAVNRYGLTGTTDSYLQKLREAAEQRQNDAGYQSGLYAQAARKRLDELAQEREKLQLASAHMDVSGKLAEVEESIRNEQTILDRANGMESLPKDAYLQRVTGDAYGRGSVDAGGAWGRLGAMLGTEVQAGEGAGVTEWKASGSESVDPEEAKAYYENAAATRDRLLQDRQRVESMNRLGGGLNGEDETLQEIDAAIANEEAILRRYAPIVQAASTYQQAGKDLNAIGKEEAIRAFDQSGNADFAQMSRYEGGEDYEAYLSRNAGDIWGSLTGKNQLENVYHYINNDGYSLDDPDNEMVRKGYALMTTQEKAEYNYRYRTGDEEGAREYLQALEPVLAQRKQSALGAYQQKVGQEHPVLATAAGAVTNLSNAMLTPAQMMAATAGWDENGALYQFQSATSNLRGGAGQRIGQEAERLLGAQWAGDAAQWLYNVGNSMIDSTVSAAIGAGLFGNGARAATAAAQLIQSSNAASAELKARMDEGMEPGKALLYAGLSGAIEAATEKWSVEELMGDPTNFGLYLLKTTISEGSEELESDLVSTLTDEVISYATGSQSDLEKAAAEYERQGMSREEAARRALQDWGLTLVSDTLAGAVSGLGSGAIYGGAGKVQQAAQTYGERREVGQAVLSNKTVSRVLDLAATLPEDSQARKMAEAAKAKRGDKLNAYTVGKIALAINKETGGQAQVLMDTLQEDARKRLEEKGETGDTAKVAEAVTALMTGEGKLTEEQRAVLTASEHGMEVVHELQQELGALEDRAGQLREAVVPEKQEVRQTTEVAAYDKGSEEVKVQGIQSVGEKAQVTVEVNGKTETRALDTIDFGNTETATAYRMAAGMENEGKAQAFLQAAQESQLPLSTVKAAVNAIYEAGAQGNRLTGMAAQYAQTMGPEATESIYKAGVEEQVRQNQRLAFDEDVNEDLRKAIAAMPEKVEESYKGVVYKGTRETKLTQAKAAQVEVLHEAAKRYGLQVELVDTLGDANGMYQGGNRMTIALDAEGGLLTRVFAHEAYHYMKQYNAEGAMELLSDIAQKLAATEGYDLDARVQEIMKKYERQGVKLDEEGAMEEIAADSLFAMLSDEETIRDLLEQHPTLGKRIVKFLRGLVQELKDMAKRLTSPEAKAMAQQTAEEMDALRQKWQEQMLRAYADREMAQYVEQEGQKAETRYNLKDSEGREIVLTERELEANKTTVANMAPVAEVERNDFDEGVGDDFVNKVVAYFDEVGGKADNKILGKVELRKSGAKHLLSQKATARRRLAIKAIKKVIEGGELIHIDNNHKNNGFDTGIIAATVTLGEGKSKRDYWMGVVVKQSGVNRDNNYYFHDAVIVPKDADNEQKKEGSFNASQPIEEHRALPPAMKDPSVASILASLKNYKSFSEKTENNFSESEQAPRYSLKDIEEVNPEMQAVLEENKRLRDAVRGLNEALSQAREGKLQGAASARSIARELRREYSSTVSEKTLTENLEKAFSAMATAKTTGEAEIAMQMMGDIALDLMKKSETVDRETYDQYKELRNRVRRLGLTERQWQEAASLFGSAGAFRRAMMGSWTPPGQTATNAVTLDMAWNELSEQYPEFFDPNATEGDMVQQMLAMLDATKIQRRTLEDAGLNVEEEASHAALEIFQKYMEMPSVAGEFRAVNSRLQDELQAAMMDMARQQERHRQDMERAREKYQRAIERQKTKVAEQTRKRHEAQEVSKLRREIMRQKGRIEKKLNQPGASGFVPYKMRTAVEKLSYALSFTEGPMTKQYAVLSRSLMQEAKDAYIELGLPNTDDYATQQMASFYNQDLASTFDELIQRAAGKRAMALNLEELGMLRDIVNSYAAAIINEDRMFDEERKESLAETGDSLLASMAGRKEHVVQGRLKKMTADALGRGLLKPVSVFHQFEGTAMEGVWKRLRNAEGKHVRNVEEASEYLEKALDKYKQHESINRDPAEARRKAKEIKLDSGRKIRLTDQELMTIYATYRREMLVGTSHLLRGGFTLQNAPKGESQAPIQVTRNDLQAMEEMLSQEQKAYVDHMIEFLSTTCAEWGNEVTRKMYGVEKFREKYYIPFSVNKNYLTSNPGQEQDQRIKTGSFTKALTQGASNAIVIHPFTQLWCEHAEKMSDYNAFVLPIEDMTRLMNYKSQGESVRAQMNRAYGTQVTTYINSFLSNLNGNARTMSGDTWLRKLSGAAKGAAVTFNLSVALQQAGAGIRASAMLGTKYMAEGTAKGTAHPGKSYREAERYAPIAVLKGWGYFDTQQARGLYDRARRTLKGKLNDVGGFLAEKGDQLNWAQIWEACKAEQEDMLNGESQETILKAAGERFQEVIDNTQVVDSIFQRSLWAFEPGKLRDSLLNFMSEPITQYNMLYRAMWDIAEAKRNADPAKRKAAMAKASGGLARSAAALVASGALTAALKTIVTALRDRDDEKKEERDGKTVIVGRRTYLDKLREGYAGNFFDSFAGLIPIYGDMLQSAFGQSYSSSGDLENQALNYFGKAAQELKKVFEGDSDDYGKVVYAVTQGLSYAAGLGFSNGFRDLNALAQTVASGFDQDFIFLQGGTVAGLEIKHTVAWDRAQEMERRIEAATTHYVYSRDKLAERGGDVGGRKQSTDVYMAMLLDAYYHGGFGEEFQAVAQAAIDTGATADGLYSSFKTHLRKTEPGIAEAAKALADGDIDAYEAAMDELVAGGLGRKAAESMVKSSYNELTKEDEPQEPGTAKDLVESLTKAMGEKEQTAVQSAQSGAFTAAVEARDPKALGAAVAAMRKEGVEEAKLRDKVIRAFRQDYCTALWNGDNKEAKSLAAMMTGAGVAIDAADLRDWATGNNARSKFYDAVDEGDIKTAIAIRKYIFAHEDKASVKDGKDAKYYIDKRLREKYKAMEGAERTSFERALLKLGYSQQTIQGWRK